MAKKRVAEQASSQPAKNHKKDLDPILTFAEKTRDHKELESRWAVLQDTRVEYFRGKDFVSFLKSHAELRKLLDTELSAQDTEEDIGSLLLKRKLICRCDRVVKTLRPGKKKLSKWPARLELSPEHVFTVDDAFYAWTFEKRRPLWQTVLSFLVPIITLACCLFPVFPQWCKLVVFYLCLACLAVIFGILFLRMAVFGLLWILLGKRVWFFPNILAEEATLSELFHFWPEPSKDEEKPPRWTVRVAFAIITGAVVWFCIHHAPDEAARARYQKKVSNIIDDVLEWSPRLALSGKQEEILIVLNDTINNVTGSESGNETQEGSDSNSLPQNVQEPIINEGFSNDQGENESTADNKDLEKCDS
eukprot:c28120_g1_i1 orf=186-1268(-)